MTGKRKAAKPNTIHFNTVDFYRVHRQMPRGTALWVFYFKDKPLEPWIAGQKENKLWPMTYTLAKSLATLEAQQRRVNSVRVDPQPL